MHICTLRKLKLVWNGHAIFPAEEVARTSTNDFFRLKIEHNLVLEVHVALYLYGLCETAQALRVCSLTDTFYHYPKGSDGRSVLSWLSSRTTNSVRPRGLFLSKTPPSLNSPWETRILQTQSVCRAHIRGQYYHNCWFQLF